jgi:hypothetical protein
MAHNYGNIYVNCDTCMELKGNKNNNPAIEKVLKQQQQ